MIDQVVANFISLAILLAVLGFFIKRWMDNLEGQLKAVCAEIEDVRKTKVDIIACHDRGASEEADSREVWVWLKYHTHTPEGHVIVPRKGD